MEANRIRFAREMGRLTAEEVGQREWRELLLFGDERYTRHFEDGLNGLNAAATFARSTTPI